MVTHESCIQQIYLTLRTILLTTSQQLTDERQFGLSREVTFGYYCRYNLLADVNICTLQYQVLFVDVLLLLLVITTNL
jgi:hypothetical protein